MIFLTKLTNTLKGISNYLLVNERINSQRCLAKDIDTTKTIIDSK
ncbi:hypothetical protein [Romboutsia sp.]|jgi:hypothetical protein|nr:hypothetical protein [Romboutsia sp.]HSQ88210.1 hypothetical protein [Romboutsia sp.]